MPSSLAAARRVCSMRMNVAQTSWFPKHLSYNGRIDKFFNEMRERERAYLEAVEGAFGADIDYAQLVKLYSPADCTGIIKTPIEGKPNPAHVSTSFIERQNLTMRMHMRRFTRLTNAFSKKVENHVYAVALHMMYYNFVKIHTKLRVSPAMAAGVSDRLWEVSDIVALWEAVEPKAGKRGAYKKRAA